MWHEGEILNQKYQPDYHLLPLNLLFFLCLLAALDFFLRFTEGLSYASLFLTSEIIPELCLLNFLRALSKDSAFLAGAFCSPFSSVSEGVCSASKEFTSSIFSVEDSGLSLDSTEFPSPTLISYAIYFPPIVYGFVCNKTSLLWYSTTIITHNRYYIPYNDWLSRTNFFIFVRFYIHLLTLKANTIYIVNFNIYNKR